MSFFLVKKVNYKFHVFVIITRGGGTSFFPVKHEKFPLSYIQDAKNFSVVKPLNSGEAVASLASPVPRPLILLFLKIHLIILIFQK